MAASPVPKPAHQAYPAVAAPARAAPQPADVAGVPVEQRALVMRLAEEVAALRRALDQSHHRIAALEIEAAEDPLSGLLNRRAFFREIDRALAFQTRYRMVCGVALVDFCGIAALTAEQGHAAGNRALRRIGTGIRNIIRSGDVAARTGNEQFGVVLWNSALPDCRLRMLGLDAAIARADIGVQLAWRSTVAMIDQDSTPEAIMSALDDELGAMPFTP